MSSDQMAVEKTTERTYEVSVTVECTCVIEVRAENEFDAVTKAKERYVREDLDVEPPHQADWRGAHVEEQDR